MPSMTAPGQPPYPALTRAVSQARARHNTAQDPVERALALGELLAALHEEILTVSAERDRAILQALREQKLSHRTLAARLGVRPQRIDALVKRWNQRNQPR